MTFKIVKKIILYSLAVVVSGFLILAVFLIRQGPDAAILMYHSVDEVGARSGLNIPLADFERQMAFLHRHRYRVISLLDYADLLRQKKRVPFKTVVITLDDGYENNFTKAWPVLKKYGFPATIFVITDRLGEKYSLEKGLSCSMLTRQMIAELSDSGLMSIGSHTRSHVYLPDVKGEDILWKEIYGSKQALEKIIKKPVDAFCYPFGGYTSRIEDLVRKAGYRVAVTTCKQRSFVHEDFYALKRINMSAASTNPAVLFVKTSGFYLRLKELLR